MGSREYGGGEEIVFVLEGTGLAWLEGMTCHIGPGDCIVQDAPSTWIVVRGGTGGLDALVFGERLPASTDVSSLELERSLSWVEPSPRPRSIVNEADVEGEWDGRWKRLALAAGATHTGLNLGTLQAGEEGSDPHCHATEAELFVVLGGGGELNLWPDERHPLCRGSVFSRPSATGVAHWIVAGESGITYLAYGERDPNEIVYFPRTNQVFLCGVGVRLNTA